MSGTTIIASILPMSVLCTSTPVNPGDNPDYSVELVGERDVANVHGKGITYGVDTAAFNEWIALNSGLAASVTPVTQAEVDAMADASNLYGFELGLQGTTAAEGVAPPIMPSDARTSLEVASRRRQQAEVQLREAATAQAMAATVAESAAVERDAAIAAQEEAAKLVAEITPPPAPKPAA